MRTCANATGPTSTSTTATRSSGDKQSGWSRKRPILWAKLKYSMSNLRNWTIMKEKQTKILANQSKITFHNCVPSTWILILTLLLTVIWVMKNCKTKMNKNNRKSINKI